MTIDFKKLRAANVARQDEWAGNEKADVLFRVLKVAAALGIDVGRAVAIKFNKTSDKYELTTMMELE